MDIVSEFTKSLNNISMNQWNAATDAIQGSNTVSDDKKKKFEENKYKDVSTKGQPKARKKARGSTHDITIKIIFSDKRNTVIDVSNYIRSFLIVKMFEDFSKPIFKINMDLPVPTILALEKSVEYKYKVEIKTAPFDKSQYDNSMQPSGDGSKLKKDLALDLYLIPYIKPPFMISPEVEKRIKGGDASFKEARLSYSVECFDKAHVKSGHKLLNCVFRNCTPLDMVTHLMYKNVDAFKGFRWMALKKPDLEEVFEHVTIPPMPYVDAIKFLQKTYNIYKRKPLIFLDEDSIYTIKRGFSQDHAYGFKPPPRVVIIIGDKESAEGGSKVVDMMKTLKANKGDIVLVSEDKPVILDKTHVVAQEVGDKSIVKSDSTQDGVTSMCLGMKDNGKTSTTCSIKYQDKAKFLHSDYEGKETFVEEKGSGRYYMELKIDQMQVDNLQIHILLRNVNVRHFNILTPILLKFTDDAMTGYDGLYFMRAVNTIYRRIPNSEAYESHTKLELARKYNDDGSAAT